MAFFSPIKLRLSRSDHGRKNGRVSASVFSAAGDFFQNLYFDFFPPSFSLSSGLFKFRCDNVPPAGVGIYNVTKAY